MKNLSVLLVSVLLVQVSLAKKEDKKDHHHHREHGKHQHGHAELTIAFDGLVGKIELETPAEAIVGFEHEAKTEKQIQQKAAALDQLEKQMANMVVFSPESKCIVTKNTIEVVQEKENKNHSDVDASFDVKCEKSIEGTKITFDFKKFFPKLKTIELTLLAGNIQKSMKIRKSGDSLEVK
jgi:hypothetical protein